MANFIKRLEPMEKGSRCPICGKLAKRCYRFCNISAHIDEYFCSKEHKEQFWNQLITNERKKTELIISLENV